MNEDFFKKLQFNADGLIPAIVQEHGTGKVLMMAWMNRESLLRTLQTQHTCFWSRSRQKFWVKGETSGHTQRVKRMAFDCDGDALLVEVEQVGAACHEGYRSCFFRDITADGAMPLNAERLCEPEGGHKEKARANAQGDRAR